MVKNIPWVISESTGTYCDDDGCEIEIRDAEDYVVACVIKDEIEWQNKSAEYS